MKTRSNEASWSESKKIWRITVQSNGVRKEFASALAGRKGKIDAERKADEWLKNGQIADRPFIILLSIFNIFSFLANFT